MKIIGFAGKRKAGKTIAANIMEDLLIQRGMDPKKLSFSFYVRQAFCRANSLSSEDLKPTDEMLKRLIDFEWRMKIKTFVDLLARDILPGDYVVIDGVHYLEHLQFIHEKGGIVYRVEADKALREMRGVKYTKGIDDHLRETDLDFGSDTFRKLGGGVLYNNKTELDLKPELEYIVKSKFLPKI